MATGKNAQTEVVGGAKDSTTAGSPKSVDKSPNYPQTDNKDTSTDAKDNAPNATDSAADDVSTEQLEERSAEDGMTNSEREKRKADAYGYGGKLSANYGTVVEEDDDDYVLAQTLVGEDLAYITTMQQGPEVKKVVYLTQDGHGTLKAKDDATSK